jgi:hypothetical protein
MSRLVAFAAAAAAVAAALAAAGCGGAARGGATPETAPCAQAIPLATSELHGQGRLVQAHELSGKRLEQLWSSGALQPRAPGAPVPVARACLLVYRGSFGPARARYAILLIRVRHPVVLAALRAPAIPHAVRRAS